MNKRFIFQLYVLVLATLAVFGRTATFDFVSYDDDIYVYDNETVQSGLTASGVRDVFVKPIIGHWHPLTWLSLMADTTMYGLNPHGFHATSVVFHVANTVLLFLALLYLTGSSWPSFAVALLFSVHPLHVEPVAWISSRKDVLSTFFLLATVLAYTHYRRRPSAARYLSVFVFLVLGLFSKSMLITLPILLALLDYWPLRDAFRASWERSRAWSAFEKVPMLALGCAGAFGAYYAGTAANAVGGAGRIAFVDRVQASVYSTAYYLKQMLWPFGLHIEYAYPTDLNLWTQVVPATLLLAVITAACLLLRARHPYLIVGWLWFLISIAPVSGLIVIGNHLRADRYTYVPVIGLFIALTWGWRSLHMRVTHKALRGVSLAASAFVFAVCGAFAWVQTGHWRDSETLFAHTLRVDPDNASVHCSMGALYMKRGDDERAEYHFLRSIESVPNQNLSYYNLGLLRARHGEFAAAAELFEQCIANYAVFKPAHRDVGIAYLRLGRYRESIESLEHYLSLKPDDADARIAFGDAFKALGELDQAEQAYRAALESDPESHEPYSKLGVLFAESGDIDRAQEYFEEALARNPSHVSTLLNLGKILYESGRRDEAISYLATAIELIEPDNPIRMQLEREVPELRDAQAEPRPSSDSETQVSP